MSKTNLSLVIFLILILIILVLVFRNKRESYSVNNNNTILKGFVPNGCIVSWIHNADLNSSDSNRLGGTLSAYNIPDGWDVCDGRAYTKTDGTTTGYTPNLVGKFIHGGSGLDYANVVNDPSEGPEWNIGNKSHMGNSDMYAANTSNTDLLSVGGNSQISLTYGQMPKHYHLLVNNNSSNDNINENNYLSGYVPEQNTTETTEFTGNTGNTGSGGSHQTATLGNMQTPITNLHEHTIYSHYHSVPDHNHGITIHDHQYYQGGDFYKLKGTSEPPDALKSSSRGGDGTNTGESNGDPHSNPHSNIPPFYTLIYIMKKY